MTLEQEQTASDQTADLLALADVERWGVIKTIRPQSVAEHCFAVTVIAMELHERLRQPNVDALMQTMMWSLWHDVPETLTGDIDGKFKRDNPEFRKALVIAENRAFPWYNAAQEYVKGPVKCLVKTADMIETISFIEMWGVGARANDVKCELRAILFDEVVPNLIRALGSEASADRVMYVVRDVLHHSTSENNSIQLRRFRRK